MDHCAIGIDLGGSSIKSVLMDTKGHILDWRITPTQAEQGFEHVVALVQNLISEIKERTGNLTVIGVGVPGMLDVTRRVVLLAPNLGWEKVNLKDILRERTGLPVYLDNDANAAAWGEYRFGGAKGVDYFMLVTIGTGIGSGIILGGELYRGANGLAPEMGHMKVAQDGPQCGCGEKGCLETLVSAPAIIRRAEEKGLNIAGGGGAKEVFDLAQRGDCCARQIVSEAMEFLAVGLKNTILLFDLQMILIGGGIGESSDAFLNILTQATMRMLPVKREIKIRRAVLGNKAGALGAACLALKEHEKITAGLG